jgi:hypothetical protein
MKARPVLAGTCGRIAAAVLLLGVASALAPQPTAQGGTQKMALVTVVAAAGAPIKDLSARDFVVREGRTTHEVVAAELAAEPLSISLLVDTTKPAMGVLAPIQELRSALSAFVKAVHSSSPDAQISLMEFAGASVTTVDFTAKAADLENAIRRLYPNHQSSAVLLEALGDAAKKLSTRPAPRRAIVSVDFNSTEHSGDRSMKQVPEEVHKSGATVWAISIRDTGASTSGREAILNAVTKANGGLRLTALEASALESLLKQVANSLISQYTVTFARPGSGPLGSIQMETTKGVKVLLSPWMR